MYIRNFNEAHNKVRTHTIKRQLTELIRQHGVDDLLKGLESAYQDAVVSRAKSSEPVRHRAVILEIAVQQLTKTQEVSAS
jgi:hypothetical protein